MACLVLFWCVVVGVVGVEGWSGVSSSGFG